MGRTISSYFFFSFFGKKKSFPSGEILQKKRVINCMRAFIIDALSVAVVLLQRSFGGQHIYSQEQE